MSFQTIFMALISLQILSLVGTEETIDGETSRTYCPSATVNGKWRLDNKQGLRCILDCKEGYSPNDCPVIRKDGYGKWNHNISSCEEDELFDKRKGACYMAIFGIIAASPYLLSLLGFGTVGIIAGSLAARWMSMIGIVSAGSIFAILQSLGMTGLSKAAMVKLFASAAGVCSGIIDIFSENPCELE